MRRLCLKYESMEKFLTKKDSHTALKAIAHDRLRSYPGGTLHVDDGLLFCTTCNTVLDHTRKSTIDKHFESATHLQRSKSANSKAAGKQQTLKTSRRQNNSPGTFLNQYFLF